MLKSWSISSAVKVCLLLALASGGDPPVALAKECPERIFAAPDSESFHWASLSDLEFSLLSGNPVDRLRFPSGKPERLLSSLIEKLAGLLELERKNLLLSLATEHRLSQPLVQTNLKLALHDLETWRLLIRSIVETRVDRLGVSHFGIAEVWAHHFIQMAEFERKQILKEIGHVYGKASSSSDGHWSPKRDLDYLIHAGLQGGELILGLIRSGRSPLAAYEAYLNLQNALVFTPQSKRGHYSAQVVLEALSAIQEGLKGSAVSEMIVGGSFTAGRADLLRSDIDYMIPPDSRYLGVHERKQLDSKINSRLRLMGLRARLHLDEFPGDPGAPRDQLYPGSFASSSPIVFRVTWQKIEMWIFPTKLQKRGVPIEALLVDPVIAEL